MSLAENLSLLYSNTVTSALQIYGTATSTSSITGALVVAGGVGIGGDINFAGNLYQNGTLFTGGGGGGGVTDSLARTLATLALP